MKAVITGARGTVGSALYHYLEKEGHTAVGWDRQQVPLDNYEQMFEFLQTEQPDVLYHLAIASQPSGRDNEGWLVNYQWPSELAWLTKELGIKFIFTSTVMVYTNNATAPFTPDTVPDETEGYGADKLRAERRVQEQNPAAIIVRLGWQIGTKAGSNNMIDFLEKQMAEHGRIEASTKWYPACSFLADTAAVLTQLATADSGLYLLNSNTRWTFYEIVTTLNEQRGRPWQVIPTENFVYDQRMLDERLNTPPLNTHLPILPAKKPADYSGV